MLKVEIVSVTATPIFLCEFASSNGQSDKSIVMIEQRALSTVEKSRKHSCRRADFAMECHRVAETIRPAAGLNDAISFGCSSNTTPSAQTRLRSQCTSGLQNGPCSRRDHRKMARQKTRMARMTMPSTVFPSMKRNRFIYPSPQQLLPSLAVDSRTTRVMTSVERGWLIRHRWPLRGTGSQRIFHKERALDRFWQDRLDGPTL